MQLPRQGHVSSNRPMLGVGLTDEPTHKRTMRQNSQVGKLAEKMAGCSSDQPLALNSTQCALPRCLPHECRSTEVYMVKKVKRDIESANTEIVQIEGYEKTNPAWNGGDTYMTKEQTRRDTKQCQRKNRKHITWNMSCQHLVTV